MRRMGVLGGIGPQATMDFEARVHAVSQRLIPHQGEAGYPPMAVIYLRHPPVLLTAEGETGGAPRPHPGLIAAAQQLGEWAEFLAIPCNGAHLFVAEIEQASHRPVLSMIDATVREIQRRGWATVGLVGFDEPLVYEQALDKFGIAWRSRPPERHPRLNACIRTLMEGRAGSAEAAEARAAVDELRGMGVDGIVLGCTEIPLLLGEAAEAPDLLNPVALLAEAAVRYALGE